MYLFMHMWLVKSQQRKHQHKQLLFLLILPPLPPRPPSPTLPADCYVPSISMQEKSFILRQSKVSPCKRVCKGCPGLGFPVRAPSLTSTLEGETKPNWQYKVSATTPNKNMIPLSPNIKWDICLHSHVYVLFQMKSHINSEKEIAVGPYLQHDYFHHSIPLEQ